MFTLKSKKILKLITLGVAILGTLAITGCGGDDDSSKSAAASDAKTIVVATRGTSKPFSYTDDNGELTGYDVEILKAIEKIDPSLHFEFKPMSTDAAFVAMDGGQVDLIANQMRRNPAREAKYLFTNEVNDYSVRNLVVKDDNNSVHSLADLQGKKVVATTNSEFVDMVKKFNETAAMPIELIYTDKGAAETLNLVATGRADAAGEYKYIVESAVKERKLPLKIVGDTLAVVPTYFVVRKGDGMDDVVKRIDADMKKLRENGTLKDLSEKFLGGDYTVEPGK